MPLDPSRRFERSLSVPAIPLRMLVALSLLSGAVALTGCAPLRSARVPNDSARPDTSGRSESAAEPSEQAPEQSEPPTSSSLPTPDAPTPRVLLVKASAYNSRRGQTDSSPSIGAWGDRLAPGMKAIAVSKDLLEIGLRRGQRVRIRGLEGEYVVMDRMPSRWNQKIDIFMGEDVRAARNWGIREVEISWVPEEDVESEAASD